MALLYEFIRERLFCMTTIILLYNYSKIASFDYSITEKLQKGFWHSACLFKNTLVYIYIFKKGMSPSQHKEVWNNSTKHCMKH